MWSPTPGFTDSGAANRAAGGGEPSAPADLLATLFPLRHAFPLVGEPQQLVPRLRMIEFFGDHPQLRGAFAPVSGSTLGIV
jgi:hypothetical protein